MACWTELVCRAEQHSELAASKQAGHSQGRLRHGTKRTVGREIEGFTARNRGTADGDADWRLSHLPGASQLRWRGCLGLRP